MAADVGHVLQTERGTGNRCGHSPHMPDLDPRWTPARGRKQIRVLERADREIGKMYGRRRGRGKHRAWTPVRAYRQARGIRRATAPRSERAEAQVRLLRYLVRRVDLAKWEVGVPHVHADDGFYRWTWEQIASAIGLSAVRVQRAASDLQYAGLIHVQRRGRGLTARKKLTMALMRVLGVADWIAGARNKRRHRGGTDAAARADAAASQMSLRACMAAAQRSNAPTQRGEADEAPDTAQPPPPDDGRSRAGVLRDMIAATET